jgi:uncharacterized protein YacL
MLLTVIRILYAFVCAGAIASLLQPTVRSLPSYFYEYPVPMFCLLMLITQSVTLLDAWLPRKRIDLISCIYFGLLIGTLLTYLLSIALQPVLTDGMSRVVISLLAIVLPYICISFLLQTKDDFRFVIPYVEFAREVKGGRPLILDSSALIDGRIADVMETQIFDTELLVPSFVLEEVQEIADSSDKVRRTRGRRGLDVLTRLQQNPKIEIRMYETKVDDFQGMTVDQQIVGLAKRLGGRVVTNDFNLNKVASVQGVDVINLNDVANALKPRYIPGEALKIRVIREGESIGQGVGYLDDGTMVVCEQAANMVGRDLDVVVTSVLQNSAGRMIFGRPAPVTSPHGVR